MPGALCVTVTDRKARDGALVPSFDLPQDCLEVFRYGLRAFAVIQNFDRLHGYLVGKVGLAR